MFKKYLEELKKQAELAGMTYDPENPNVKAMQKQHGDQWSNVLAKQRGITPESIQPISKQAGLFGEVMKPTGRTGALGEKEITGLYGALKARKAAKFAAPAVAAPTVAKVAQAMETEGVPPVNQEKSAAMSRSAREALKRVASKPFKPGPLDPAKGYASSRLGRKNFGEHIADLISGKAKPTFTLEGPGSIAREIPKELRWGEQSKADAAKYLKVLTKQAQALETEGVPPVNQEKPAHGAIPIAPEYMGERFSTPVAGDAGSLPTNEGDWTGDDERRNKLASLVQVGDPLGRALAKVASGLPIPTAEDEKTASLVGYGDAAGRAVAALYTRDMYKEGKLNPR